MNMNKFSIEATATNRQYVDGPARVNGDENVHQRYFTYQTADGALIAGVSCSVMFTIDRPARDVWPYLQDFNSWQNASKHYYSGELGKLEGKTFRLSDRPNDDGPHYYEVVKVIPEYLIVVNQPVPTDGTSAGLPGLGGVSPGFHVFMLNEHEGRTTVSVMMDHSSISEAKNDQEALKPWRDVVETHWMTKWCDEFIRNLKARVREGQAH